MANEMPKAQSHAAPIQPYQNLFPAAFQFWAGPVLFDNDGRYYCPGFEGPTYSTSPWDTVVVGVPYTDPDKPQTPGIAEVSVEKYRDVDKKKAAGKDGARVTIHGIEPAMIEIKLIIWTPDQLRVLSELWPVLFPKMQKGTPPAFDIDHPMTRIHDVKSVIFVRGDGPMPGPVVRSRVFTMKAVEYLPPGKKKATVTPVKPIGSPVNDPPVTTKPGANPDNTGPNGGPHGT